MGAIIVSRRFSSALLLTAVALVANAPSLAQSSIGKELSVPRHLEDGQEFSMPLRDLVVHGERLFTAMRGADDR